MSGNKPSMSESIAAAVAFAIIASFVFAIGFVAFALFAEHCQVASTGHLICIFKP